MLKKNSGRSSTSCDGKSSRCYLQAQYHFSIAAQLAGNTRVIRFYTAQFRWYLGGGGEEGCHLCPPHPLIVVVGMRLYRTIYRGLLLSHRYIQIIKEEKCRNARNKRFGNYRGNVRVCSSQIHSACLREIVDSCIGLSYQPASLCSLAGRYDNPMPESAISPSQRL